MQASRLLRMSSQHLHGSADDRRTVHPQKYQSLHSIDHHGFQPHQSAAAVSLAHSLAYLMFWASHILCTLLRRNWSIKYGGLASYCATILLCTWFRAPESLPNHGPIYLIGLPTRQQGSRRCFGMYFESMRQILHSKQYPIRSCCWVDRLLIAPARFVVKFLYLLLRHRQAYITCCVCLAFKPTLSLSTPKYEYCLSGRCYREPLQPKVPLPNLGIGRSLLVPSRRHLLWLRCTEGVIPR